MDKTLVAVLVLVFSAVPSIVAVASALFSGEKSWAAKAYAIH